MNFVITAGPTREPLDPVRYLSNRSSGKMGYAIAEAALESGHDVLLISGPVALNPPPGAKVISILSSDEMHDAVHDHLHGCDVLVMCAAVADYKPAKVSQQKIKKRHAPLSLELIPTRDILPSVAKPDRQFLLVGFAAETNNLEEYAQKKLREKNCDLIVANNVLTGIDSDENEVTIFSRTGEQQKISRAPKKSIARELVKFFLNSCEKRLTKKM